MAIPNIHIDQEVCPVCERVLGSVRVSDHHLVPKSRGGKTVSLMHDICHAKIHHTFTNKELEEFYNTAERIQAHPEMQKFIKWVSRKDPSFYDKNADTADRRRKR